MNADDLEVHYRHTLEALGNADGVIGVIFRKAQNKIQDPAKLKRPIVDLIDKEEWVSLDSDLKGDAYEGLLPKNADSDNLPPPAVIAAEIVEDLQAALDQLRELEADLQLRPAS